METRTSKVSLVEHVDKEIYQEDKYSFDMLKMYFGDDYQITDKIKIHQPTIGEIVEYGEHAAFGCVSPFTGNTTSYRVLLWDAGIDWNKVTDWELFLQMYKTMSPETTYLIFGDFDFSKLVPLKDEEGNVALYEVEYDDNGIPVSVGDMVIDEDTYEKIASYLRAMLNQHPRVRKCRGKMAKEIEIRRDREKLEKSSKEQSSSFLLPLISGCLNHPGFKYKKNELREIGIVEFMDSVQRLQVYEQTTSFLKGMYSGMLDTSKMSKTELNKNVNWLQDIYSKDDQ